MSLKGMVGVMSVLVLAVYLMVGIAGAAPKTEDKTTTGKVEAAKPQVKETVVMEWPKDGKWTSGFKTGNDKGQTELFFPQGSSTGGWTEMGSIEAVPGKPIADLTGMARVILMGTQQGCPDARLEILEKKTDLKEYPWIIFEIRCPKFLAEQPPEIQFWRIISGKSGLLTVQYSYRGEQIPEDKRIQILTAIKGARVVQETNP